ncbi:MAG: ribonuclease III [Deferribacteraceae bacterium]|jgi:ribonuclease III|nr:ribonuclease III [Deferribacteraceae bacterium]
MTNDSISELEQILGYKFHNSGFLQEALIHSSYAHENNLKCSNERFELLGDAVIHLAITEFLMTEYPQEAEGPLSALRSYCESEPFLYEIALCLELGRFIRFGRGEILSGGMHKESLLSSAYEALIAAVHNDGGFKVSSKMVLSHLQDKIRIAHDKRLYMDSKSELQKLTQKHYDSLPIYEVVAEKGAEHDKFFCIEVTIHTPKGKKVASGHGRNKKIAEKDAARKMLETL